jgi:hypothetical protein
MTEVTPGEKKEYQILKHLFPDQAWMDPCLVQVGKMDKPELRSG